VVHCERHGARRTRSSKDKDAHNASAPFYFTNFLEQVSLLLL